MTKKRPKKKHISRAVYSLSLFDQFSTQLSEAKVRSISELALRSLDMVRAGSWGDEFYNCCMDALRMYWFMSEGFDTPEQHQLSAVTAAVALLALRSKALESEKTGDKLPHFYYEATVPPIEDALMTYSEMLAQMNRSEVLRANLKAYSLDLREGVLKTCFQSVWVIIPEDSDPTVPDKILGKSGVAYVNRFNRAGYLDRNDQGALVWVCPVDDLIVRLTHPTLIYLTDKLPFMKEKTDGRKD